MNYMQLGVMLPALATQPISFPRFRHLNTTGRKLLWPILNEKTGGEMDIQTEK